MRGRLVIVAAATAVLAAGCGGHSKHRAVADYITRVDDVEQGMAAPLQQVSLVDRSFARSQANPRVQVELASSERTMRRLRLRLQRVTAPAEAAHLRALLLDLVDHELELTHETRQLAAFVGRYQSALQPMRAASATLKATLAKQTKGTAATKALDAQKADELVRFAGTADDVAAKLRALDPPPVWRPAYRDQLVSLTELRTAALRLASAIRANDSAAIPKLLEQFDGAAVANQTVAAQKRQIAAVKAYDARIRALIPLAHAVQVERARLQTKYK